MSDPRPGYARGGFGPLLRSVAVLAGLAGCGPVYETRYELTPPPASQASAACLAGCEVQRSACIQRMDEQFALCRSQAQLDALSCRSWSRFGRSDRWGYPYDCVVPICLNDRASCEAGFQACYRGCGGQVTPRQVCVERCPEDASASLD